MYKGYNMNDAIVFLATAWGSKHGGINSFNHDLVLSLTSMVSSAAGKIICVVPTEPKKEDREHAESKGVILLSLGHTAKSNDLTPESADEIIAKLNRYSPIWWVGHDVKTGPIALKARDICGGRCALIHHMDYEAYLPYYDNYPADIIEFQRQVLLEADVVFAVGPKLARSAADKLRSKENRKVVELIPGLAPVRGLGLQNRFSAIAFGRLDPAQDRLKQAKLAVVSFGRACRKYGDIIGDDASLTIIGLSEQSENEDRLLLKKILDQEAQRAVPLHGWPFIEDREALLDCLRQHSVCLMLSLHEGFGLVGWEAIAAEVPLIVSTNTGVYDAVSKYLGGVGRGCLRPVTILGATTENSYRDEDVEKVSIALREVSKQGAGAKKDAQVLKGLLQLACTWEHTALDVAKACELPVSRDLAHDSLAKWTPDLLIEALKKGSDIVEEASRRKDYFAHIWRRLSTPSKDVKRHLILFGGISQTLCSQEASERFGNWLKENANAELFLCYEVDEAASARALKLNEDTLETESGLSPRAFERMLQKQKRVEAIPDLIKSILGLDSVNVLERFHLVQVKKPLSTYVIIADNEVYLTPLFEKRASDSLSFALSTKPSMVQEVVSSVIYHLENVEKESSEVKKLAAKLRKEFHSELNRNQG